ncbi:hypothetical protein BH23PLA1_BH23PLA1_11990 [soil metagenome]
MISINIGLTGDRDDMELWFQRAIEANPNNRDACLHKMEWLEPKWHGSPEELLAFGRACRDSGNVRAGITLLSANAHWRFTQYLDPESTNRYFRSDSVIYEIMEVYQKYFDLFPSDNIERTNFAMYCALAGRINAAEVEFRAVGDDLLGSNLFPHDYILQIREFVAERAMDPADLDL